MRRKTSATSASDRSSGTHAKALTFGEVIRRRRRDLGFTLKDVAGRIKTSKPYIAHLESGNRHPSAEIVGRLANVLGLDNRELFFLANPHAKAMLANQPESTRVSVWERFRADPHIQRIHNISEDEMEVLARVALMGQVHSEHDLIYVLNAIRHAVGR